MSDFGVQLGLFEPADLGERSLTPAPTTTRLVTSDDDFARLLREVEAADRVAFDTETTTPQRVASGVDMTRNTPLRGRCDLIGISICTQPHEGWYLPVGLDGTERWSLYAPQLAQLKQALNASRGQLTAHNAKFDLGVLKRHGVEITPERPVYDTLIAQFAVDPFLHGRAGGYGLKALAKRHLGWDMTEIESLIGRRGQQVSMRDVPVELVAPYAAADADATWRLAEALEPQVRALNLERLLHEVEFPLLPVLMDMELAGVAVDLPYLARLSGEMHARMHILEDEIHRYAGRIFNVGSPQLSAVLYGLLGLQVNFADIDSLTAQDRTPSTRAHRLESVKDKHPIILGLCRKSGSSGNLMVHVIQVGCSTRRRRRSNLARPNIKRLIILSRLTWPSVGPLLHFIDSAALIAA